MLRLGGKTGPASGDPVDAWCTVRALRPDMAMTGLGGAPMALGDVALVEIEPDHPAADTGAGGPGAASPSPIQVVLISLRNQAMGTDLFTGAGCDLAAQRLVVVKSAQHFHAAFAPMARAIVYVGGPGAASPDLATLGFRRIQRPKWPLDPIEPRATALPLPPRSPPAASGPGDR